MRKIKITAIILAVCVIVCGMSILFNDHKQNIEREKEANFHIEAIEKFWGNEELFEQIIEHFLAMPDNVISDPALSVTIYYDRDNDCISIADQNQGWFENLVIDDEFEQNLLSLGRKLTPMSMSIRYMFDAERAENKAIKFELDGGIKRKGILHIVTGSEDEINKKLPGIGTLTFLKESWYYYEELLGV